MTKINENLDSFADINEKLNSMMLAAKGNDVNIPNYYQAINESNTYAHIYAMILKYNSLDKHIKYRILLIEPRI